MLTSWVNLFLPHSSVSKESACDVGDPGWIPGLGRFPGEGNGNPLQYSCLENPMDRGSWRATVHGLAGVRHYLVTKPPPPTSWVRECSMVVLCKKHAASSMCFQLMFAFSPLYQSSILLWKQKLMQLPRLLSVLAPDQFTLHLTPKI